MELGGGTSGAPLLWKFTLFFIVVVPLQSASVRSVICCCRNVATVTNFVVAGMLQLLSAGPPHGSEWAAVPVPGSACVQHAVRGNVHGMLCRARSPARSSRCQRYSSSSTSVESGQWNRLPAHGNGLSVGGNGSTDSANNHTVESGYTRVDSRWYHGCLLSSICKWY